MEGNGLEGITTVTFRNKTWEEILAMCVETGVRAVEWGGDVHVLPDNLELAEMIGQQTRSRGIAVTSYGSYYRLGTGNANHDFTKIADTAVALGAPLVRIWAGGCGSAVCGESDRGAMTKELRAVCAVAAKRNLSVGLEYHRRTLTDTKESTLRLLQEAGCPNLFTYWQLNPEIHHEERLEELKLLKPYLCAVHVFYWKYIDTRYALADGELEWREYMRLLNGFEGPFLLEFVKGDEVRQMEEDYRVLRSWRYGSQTHGPSEP